MRALVWAFVLSLPALFAWVYLFVRDWRVAVALFVIMWTNNFDIVKRFGQ